MSLVLSLLLFACANDKVSDDSGATAADGGVGDSGDSGAAVDPFCADLGLAVRDFDPTEPAATHRWEPAGDFTVPLRDGSAWTLSEQWTGCETYSFLPHWWTISDLDDESWWTTGVDDLIDGSPRNAHYFFVVLSSDDDEAESFGAAMDTEIGAALAELDDDEAAFWAARLHVVAGPSTDLDGLVGDMFSTDTGLLGFAVDRSQRIHTLGYPSAVEAYDSALSSAGLWPYENRLYTAAYEAIGMNYEDEQAAALDARLEAAAGSEGGTTTVEVFDGSVVSQYTDGVLSLPTNISAFDTLLVEVVMECPDPDAYELNNCGAWDYLAHLWLYDEAAKSWLEMSRFITTYHRESHWIVDASFALGWLQEGGERTVRFEWAPEWNVQPTGVTVKVHLLDEGKGLAARQVTPLFQGGSFSTTYNSDRPPVDVEVPAEAKKVELVWLATGHGGDTYNCAEFCEHAHAFTVGASTWEQSFDDAGASAGCQDAVAVGTTPNQAGTWWYGRGGWCPGARVDPMVIDVSAEVTPGSVATISYAATIMGSEPIDGVGSAELYSWLVVSW